MSFCNQTPCTFFRITSFSKLFFLYSAHGYGLKICSFILTASVQFCFNFLCSSTPWKSFPTHEDLWPRQQANFTFYGNYAPDVQDFYSIPVDHNKHYNNKNKYQNENSKISREKTFSEAISENANRVATVGRNRPKPPPNTLYPEIPEPDYSPIEDKKLKSVLRSTSHYM